MNRRTVLRAGSVALSSGISFADEKTYRVGVIGHTGRGNFGHGLDKVWLKIPATEIVAVADADQNGLSRAQKALKVESRVPDNSRRKQKPLCS